MGGSRETISGRNISGSGNGKFKYLFLGKQSEREKRNHCDAGGESEGKLGFLEGEERLKEDGVEIAAAAAIVMVEMREIGVCRIRVETDEGQFCK